jgi:hypothetical protein
MATFLLTRENHAREIFEVYLMDYSRIRWDYPEIAELILPPAKESVAFLVALQFHKDIRLEGVGSSESVHLHRMVDHEIDRQERVDPVWVAAHPDHGISHDRQIHYARNARKILEQNPRRHE